MTEEHPPEVAAPLRDTFPQHEANRVVAGLRPVCGIYIGVLLVLGAAFAMLALGVAEAFWATDQPGANSLMVLHPEAAWEDALPVEVRRIPLEQAFEADPFVNYAYHMFQETEVLDILGGRRTEMLAHVPLDTFDLVNYLESGRLPEPGKPEVLAGDLCRFDRFEIDGVSFEVVGRLHNTVAAALYAYILPRHEAWDDFFDAEQTLQGIWIFEMAEDAGPLRDYLIELFSEEEAQETAEDVQLPELDDMTLEEFLAQTPDGSPTLRAGKIRTHPVFAWSGIILLMLASLGGAWTMYYGLIWWFQRNPDRPNTYLSRAVIEWRGVYVTLHLLLYAVTFTAMFAGKIFPLQNYWLEEHVIHIFSEGGLQYVGDAYASGNILRAAWATFYNNYIEQTLLMVYAISLAAIPFGVLKSAFSFALVGFVMTPTWAGQIVGFSYHSITMVLELQAYILACFAVLMWPVYLLWGIAQNRFKEEAKKGLYVLAHSAVLIGVVLLVAAFYEAVTLILIGGAGKL